MAAQANEFGDVPVKKVTPNEFGDLPVSPENPQLAQNQQIISKRDAAVTPQGSALSRFGGGLLNGAKGLVMSAVPGLPEIVNGAKGYAAGGIPGVEKAVHDASPAVQAVRGIRAMGPVGMKDVPEIAGRALSAIVPGGPQAAQAGEQIGSGDVAGGLGTAAGAVLPLVGGEVPVSRLRSPITFGEPRLPSLSEIGQKAGAPVHAGPATAIPWATLRAISGAKFRSPLKPIPGAPYEAPYLDPQGPADLRTPSAPYEAPYLPVKGPEPPPPVSRNPSWRGLAPQAEAAPTSAPIPAAAMPSGRVPGNGIPKPAPPAENFQPPYLSPHGPPADDFVPPYLDPQGPFSEAHAKGISGDIAQQLKDEMEASGTLPKGKGITPPAADAQPAIVTGQRLARAATSSGIAGDLKAQGITPDKLPASDDIGGWQKLFEQNGSPFRKTPEAQRKMIDAVQKEFEKQSQPEAGLPPVLPSPASASPSPGSRTSFPQAKGLSSEPEPGPLRKAYNWWVGNNPRDPGVSVAQDRYGRTPIVFTGHPDPSGFASSIYSERSDLREERIGRNLGVTGLPGESKPPGPKGFINIYGSDAAERQPLPYSTAHEALRHEIVHSLTVPWLEAHPEGLNTLTRSLPKSVLDLTRDISKQTGGRSEEGGIEGVAYFLSNQLWSGPEFNEAKRNIIAQLPRPAQTALMRMLPELSK